MKLFSRIIFSFLILSSLFVPPLFVQAQTSAENPHPMSDKSIPLTNPLKTTDVKVLVGDVIKYVLGIMGSLTLCAFVFGGYMWLTSAGNPEKVKTGSQTFLYATIGLFIIFGAYAILNTILKGVAK